MKKTVKKKYSAKVKHIFCDYKTYSKIYFDRYCPKDTIYFGMEDGRIVKMELYDSKKKK